MHPPRLESSSGFGSGASSSSQQQQQQQPACALTVMLLYEVVSDLPLTGLVPINTLRNAALLATRTAMVAMIDVDLAPSTSLVGKVLRQADRWGKV